MNHRIGIIVPVLNEAETLAGKAGYFQQLAQQCEVVFVDGGSTDETVSILKKWRIPVRQCRTCGRGAQLDMGVNNVSSHTGIVLFLHVDTELPKNFLNLVSQQALTHHWGHFKVHLDSSRPVFRIIECMMNLRTRWSGIATGDLAIYVNKSAYLQFIKDLAEYPIMEDIHLSKSLKKICGYPAVLPACVKASSRYWQTKGIAKAILKMWLLRFLFFIGVPAGKLYSLYY